MVRRGGGAASTRGARTSRGSRQSTDSGGSSPAQTSRGRRRRSEEGATTAPAPCSPAAEITEDGRRVSRRQKMPNKRLMPITNGRLADLTPETGKSPSPARGGRRSRGTPASGRTTAARGRRRTAASRGESPELASHPAEMNGSLDETGDGAASESDTESRVSGGDVLNSAAADGEEDKDGAAVGAADSTRARSGGRVDGGGPHGQDASSRGRRRDSVNSGSNCDIARRKDSSEKDDTFDVAARDAASDGDAGMGGDAKMVEDVAAIVSNADSRFASESQDISDDRECSSGVDKVVHSDASAASENSDSNDIRTNMDGRSVRQTISTIDGDSTTADSPPMSVYDDSAGGAVKCVNPPEDPVRMVTPTPLAPARCSSPLEVADCAMGEAASPPSPVRFKDPLERSAGDPMDLDSTLEEEGPEASPPHGLGDRLVIQREAERASDADAAEVRARSGDLKMNPTVAAGCSDVLGEPEVDTCRLGVPVTEGADGSRSPVPTDPASGGDALDSRSPPAEASLDGLLSPAPPPDPDDNACSFPSMPSKASDSEDSQLCAPLPASAPPPSAAPLESAAVADGVAVPAAGDEPEPDATPAPAAVAMSSPAAAASSPREGNSRESSPPPAPCYSEDELDDPTGELAALWPPPPTCGVRLPAVGNEDSQSSVASDGARTEMRPPRTADVPERDRGVSPSSLGARLKRLEMGDGAAGEAGPVEDGMVPERVGGSAPGDAADVQMIPVPSDANKTPVASDSEQTPMPSDSERTPMPSAESSLSVDAVFWPQNRLTAAGGSDMPPKTTSLLGVDSVKTGVSQVEIRPSEDLSQEVPQSPVDMDISGSSTPTDEPPSSTCVAAIPLPPTAAPGSTQTAPAASVASLRKASQEGSVPSEDRASPFMGLFQYDEDSRSPLVTYAAADEPSPEREVRITPDAEPPAQEKRAASPVPESGADAGEELGTSLVGRVINSYVGIRKQRSKSSDSPTAPKVSAAPVRVAVPPTAILLKSGGGDARFRVLTESQLEAMTRGPAQAIIAGARPVVVRQGELLAQAAAIASGVVPTAVPTPLPKPVKPPVFKFKSVPGPAEEPPAPGPRREGDSDSNDSCYEEADAVVQMVVDAAHREAVAAQQEAARSQEAAGTEPASGSAASRARKPKSIVMERYAASGSPAGKAAELAGDITDPRNIPLPPGPTTPPSRGRGGRSRQKAAAQPPPPPPEPDTKDEDQAALAKAKYKDSRVDAIQEKDLNKLRKFKVIQDVIWLKKPKTTKQQKEARRMICDCCLSPEETERGDMGCGEDCLNRLLMIECGPRCPLGDRCSNKRFTRRERFSTEVFKTELKGYGLRAAVDMPAKSFIYEYVGEVLDGEEFRRRTAEYDRLKYHHYYFMALKADAVIDATEKGNDSRFINHSCDPNSETQKWTVNGELRVGFFTRHPVRAGEEITFDYQLQRYGKEAQKCFCGSELCRGWIGEKTDDSSSEESESEPEEPEREPVPPAAVPAGTEPGVEEVPPVVGTEEVQKPPPAPRRTKLRKDAEKRDLENEISKLVASGLKSKQHTLELSRLMVRAESDADRLTLLELIRAADQPCRRLFLDYHGLRLMWSWMASAPSPQGPGDLEWKRFRMQILETLAVLPIPNKTTLKDSRVLSVVERWAAAAPGTPDLDPPSDQTPSDAGAGDEPGTREVSEVASRLLDSWAGLKEVFRIPKKERVELMREHEKEADRGYQTYLQQQPRPAVSAAKKGYDWSPERRKRARDSPEPDQRVKKYRTFVDSRLTKEERRQLFMLEVQREEAERQQRQQQQQLWRGHEQRCTMLGLDPFLTPIFDPSYQYYWEPSAGAWQPYTPGDPAVPLVPAPGVDPLTVAALPQQLAVYQSLAAADPTQAERYLQQLAEQRAAPPQPQQQPPPPPEPDPSQRPGLLELLQARLPGRFVDGEGRQIPLPPAAAAAAFTGYRLACYCDPALPSVSVSGVPLPEVVSLPQPPPPPPQPSVTLPPGWRLSKDVLGRFYYYHKVTRESRWDPPPVADWSLQPPTTTEWFWTGPESAENSPVDDDGDSSSSSSSESDSSSDDEADKKGEDEEDAALSELPEDMAKEEEIDRRRMVDQKHRRSGKRRDRLVQERVISPVPEMSRHELRRERHRQKREAKAEARRERRWERAAAERRPRRRRPPSSPPAEPEQDEEEPSVPAPAEEAEVQESGDGDMETSPPPEAPEEETISPEEEIRRREEAIRKFRAKEEALRKHLNKKQEAARRKRKLAAKIAAKAEAKAALKAEAKAAAKAEARAAKAEAAREEAAAEIASASKKRRKEDAASSTELPKASSKKRKVEIKRTSSLLTASTAADLTAGSTSGYKEKPTTAAADTSSEVARKIKDKFLAQMSSVIVSALNVFRKSSCKQGRIASTEDFKYLAKKLTHHVMIKELKNVQQVEELSASDSVKHKAKYYVKKYMGRYGAVYSREAGGDDVEGEPAH